MRAVATRVADILQIAGADRRFRVGVVGHGSVIAGDDTTPSRRVQHERARCPDSRVHDRHADALASNAGSVEFVRTGFEDVIRLASRTRHVDGGIGKEFQASFLA